MARLRAAGGARRVDPRAPGGPGPDQSPHRSGPAAVPGLPPARCARQPHPGDPRLCGIYRAGARLGADGPHPPPRDGRAPRGAGSPGSDVAGVPRDAAADLCGPRVRAPGGAVALAAAHPVPARQAPTLDAPHGRQRPPLARQSAGQVRAVAARNRGPHRAARATARTCGSSMPRVARRAAT